MNGRDLENWLQANRHPATIEAITPRVAGVYITETFIGPGVHPITANSKPTARAITAVRNCDNGKWRRFPVPAHAKPFYTWVSAYGVKKG